MAIYEYECLKCLKSFDVMKKIADKDKIERCPHCLSKETKRKVVSKSVTHILKGKGWYKDGY